MNKLICEILSIDSQDQLCFLRLACGSECLGVMTLDSSYYLGQRLWACFNESDVMIALDPRISARNKFLSPIHSIEHNTISARLSFDFQGHPLSSLISYEACKELGLREGMQCYWFVKSSEILLLDA